MWPAITATIGVQEPFAGTIRFKWLVRLSRRDLAPFLDDPMGWIGERYGGGKFKMNLHHGLHFVNTKNFKPAGEPRWAARAGAGPGVSERCRATRRGGCSTAS